MRSESDVLIVIVGDGADKDRLQERVSELGLQCRVQFIERQLPEKMCAFMAASDVLLMHLKKSELSRYVIPTKTLAYWAAGRPILVAMDGAAAELVRKAGAGPVIPPENPSAMVSAIRSLGDLA